ncbi:TauD/TfdA family dioxygenase [Streptomyces sp. ISL-86]|uniref:TauD/TfdA dioxygenase family protein n=1 Tax=Streptomyces sp. ISL-86 TaxID=2819187 RepID=UPI001BE8D842|nr:TauD/TfdA family dioxygenase [Streptomyces sp. ISL-86]MBT2456052.1 TauD/TfdA family dioxygenase [Streptomyces sp. ISL-86]
MSLLDSEFTEAETRVGPIVVRRLAGFIGAELEGVDASAPLSEETVATVRSALLAHKVIFMRGQSLDYESLSAFAGQFGPLTPGHPIYQAPADQPHVRVMDSRGDGTRANYWHTDLTFIEAPPAFAFLHNIVCPPVGGDTIWANTAAAYEALPPELKALANDMRVVHSNNSDYTEATYAHNPRARAEYISHTIEANHPAVRVHPETGEPSLLLGGFARSVAGHRPRAGRDVIGVLEDYATQPEFTVRWKWQAGDVAIWDNQATMHYAVLDYGTQHRSGIRVTVQGEAPLGLYGRKGFALSSPLDPAADA